MSIGRSTRVWAVVVTGDRRLVRALLVDLVGLHDLGVRVVRVDLGDDLAAVVVGVVVVGRRRRARDRMLPQSSTRSRRCCGLVTHAAPVSTSLIHTQPLTSRSRSSDPAPSSGACWHLGPRRRRRRRTTG